MALPVWNTYNQSQLSAVIYAFARKYNYEGKYSCRRPLNNLAKDLIEAQGNEFDKLNGDTV
jgi:hypothetical protein